MLLASGTATIVTRITDRFGINSASIEIDGATVKTCERGQINLPPLTDPAYCWYDWSVGEVRPGSHTITAIATDRASNVATTSIKVVLHKVIVPISPINELPTATIGYSLTTSTTESRTVFASTTSHWYFTGVDPEGSLLSYAIDWGDGQTMTGVSSSGVTFAKPHTYYNFTTSSITRTIRFTVKDNVGYSGTATSSVIVLPPNQPPIAYVYGSSTVPVGVSNPWFFQAYDPEGFSLTYIINWGDITLPIQGIVSSSLSFFPLSHTYTLAGIRTISIYVTDSGGLSARSSIPVSVGNKPPYFTRPFIGPTSTVSGVSKTWYATAVDPEGGLLNYHIDWDDGSSNTQRVATSGVPMSFPHTYYTTSSIVRTIRFTVKDNVGYSGTATSSVIVLPTN